jgi:hypothetical protein
VTSLAEPLRAELFGLCARLALRRMLARRAVVY